MISQRMGGAFFGNTLCLSNRALVADANLEQFKNSGNINVCKILITRGTRPSTNEGFGMGSALP